MRKFAVLAPLLCLALLLAPSPAAANAEKTLVVAYTCTGGPISTTTLNVTLAVPDTATGSFDVTWRLPALTLRAAPAAAAQLQVRGRLAVTGGTHEDLSESGGTVTQGSTGVPAFEVTSTVQVTATTGGQVTIKPATGDGGLEIALSTTPADVTRCSTTSTGSVTVTVGQGGGDPGTGDIVEYTCTPASGAAQTVRIRTTLTLPATSPRAGEQFTIRWQGAYEGGAELEAPNGLPTTGLKMYAYASISRLPGLTSATGVAELTGVTVGETIPLPASVDMRTTSQRAGTALVKPASVNFGLLPGEPLIECEPTNPDSLRTYELTIGNGGTTTSPTATPTITPTATPTVTRTAVVTATPTEDIDEEEPRRSITPRDGVATGGGGMAGPDGRMFVLAGSALILVAAAGGLAMRRTRRMS